MTLSDFVIFSGGGASANSHTNYDTAIGGHSIITGNIGSNQDLKVVGGGNDFATQINGSVYVGGYLDMGQPLTVGTSSQAQEIVVNGVNPFAPPPGAYEASFLGDLYGSMFVTGDVDLGTDTDIMQVFGLGGTLEYTGNRGAGGTVQGGATQVASTKQFALVTMPTATSFAAGGADQTCNTAGCPSLTLAPNTAYGTLTTSQNKSVYLSSDNYYFDAVSAGGGLTLYVDLTSGQPINVYILGLASFGQSNTLMVKGQGTGGNYVSIADAPSLAGLIYFETHDRWVMNGGTLANPNVWGGTVYASLREDSTFGGSVGEVTLGQYMRWYGAIYAFDSVDIADHGVFTHEPLTTVPEPVSLLLLGSGLCGLAYANRRRRRG